MEISVNEQDLTIRHHGRVISGRAFLPQGDRYPIVVFSHGFNGSGEDFRAQAETLAKNGIGALTYDFCGGALSSKSDMRTDEMTVFTEKEDLLSVLDTIKAWQTIDHNNIFLFGASMGGLVSALAAEECAGEIRGMVLLYPALCVADDWNKRFPHVEDIPQKHDVWGVPLGKCFFEELHGFDVFSHIGKYPGNVLIMHGDEDGIVPLAYSKRAQGIYPNSRLEVFGGEGHGFSASGSDKMTRMLLEFVLSETGHV